jgi:capsular exopolysaccharide synthesis family protein
MNLAVVAARSSRRVLLVSTDLRRATLEQAFGLENEPGLVTWMSAGGPLRPHIHRTPLPDLHVLPAGERPAEPSELIASDQMNELVQRLEQAFDLVIFDSPPVLPVADTILLARHTDGVVLVVRADETAREAVNLASERLGDVDARLLGTVLNGVAPTASPYEIYESGQEGQPIHLAPLARPVTSPGSHPLRRETDVPPPPPER